MFAYKKGHYLRPLVCKAKPLAGTKVGGAMKIVESEGGFFLSYLGWNRGDGEKPASITPDFPRRSLLYWDGQNLSTDKPTEERV